MKGTVIEKFMKKVNKTDTCWLWKASTRLNGYGQLRIENCNMSAHVLSYMLHKGNIPNGMLVRHSCDNRLCVNPEHLLLGTHKDNRNDTVTRNRDLNQHDIKTHCKYGHEFNEENTYFYPIKSSGGTRRSCKICIMNNDKKRRKNVIQEEI